MEKEIEKILELAEILYQKGMYEEVWNNLSRTYQNLGKDQRVKEALIKYFYYPSRDAFLRKFEENKIILMRSGKVYGYVWEGIPEQIECESQVLWTDADILFYHRDGEIRAQKLYISIPEVNVRGLYVNIIPELLPKQSKYPLVLYYDAETFECCMQISSFQEILEKCAMILVGKGLEAYIESFGKIDYDIAIGEINGISDRFENAYRQFVYHESRKSFGMLYNDCTFYVVRVRKITSSLGPLMLWVLNQLKKIEQAEYIPVIDFSNFENPHLEKDEVGIINSWEYYFEQPTQFGLPAAYHAKNVILGNADPDAEDAENLYFDLDRIVESPEVFKEYCEIFERYIHISKRIEKKAKKIYEHIVEPGWRVLGVVYRGTDYRNRAVPGEHRQPDIEDLMEKAENLMGAWNCDHFFLATEDKGAVTKFQNKFGDKLVFVERERYESTVKYTQNYEFEREFDDYLKGEEYLTEIYCLSRCNCLLSSRVGILAVALPMNASKYEEKYIYDLGIYEENDF